MKRLNYLWIFLILASVSFGTFDNTKPADSDQWNIAAGLIRTNNNAIEVVLGINLSMEGSASPWFQASTPTTTADGSTALTAANNGLLWIDSDTRILTAYIHGTGFRGIDAVPAVVTFTAADATPTVVLSSAFTTDSGGLTITDFDDGTDGKYIVVLSKGAVVYDTTTAQDADHNLDGSSGDITTASGDITVWRNEGGTTWYLVRFNDASVDNSDSNIAEKATVAYVDTQVATQGFGNLTGADSESNPLVKDHAYLAQQDGVVHTYILNTGGANRRLSGYNGTTNDPVGSGALMVSQNSPSDPAIGLSITFAVESGRYWEVTMGTVEVTDILWQPTQTTGGSPIDQD